MQLKNASLILEAEKISPFTASPASYGWRRPSDWRFARCIAGVALSPAEIWRAGQYYPVAFIRMSEGWRAMAVFSVVDGENRFVDSVSGDWLAGYAPALLRAAPFMLHSAESNALRFWPGLAPEPMREGLEPFLIDGQPAPKLLQILAALKEVYSSLSAVDHVVDLLAQHEALVPWRAASSSEQSLRLMGNTAWVLDRERFYALGDDIWLMLRDSRAIEWLSAHLHSLVHLHRMLAPLVPASPAINLDLRDEDIPQHSKVSVHADEVDQLLRAMFPA